LSVWSPENWKDLKLAAAMAAILKKYKGGKKIFPIAPSQRAADVVGKRLIENFNVDPTAMFRSSPL
jgi:hypothetical protein